MNNKKALGLLITHNRWRRGEDSEPMLKPSDIGKAIDVAINALEDLQEREGIDDAIVSLNDKLAVRYASGEMDDYLMDLVELEAKRIYSDSLFNDSDNAAVREIFTQGAKYYKELTEKQK